MGRKRTLVGVALPPLVASIFARLPEEFVEPGDCSRDECKKAER